MFNRKSARQFVSAALMALGAVATGSAHAGNVQWSVSVNLPPVGTVVSSVPVYSVPAPVYHPPMPAPVVVYRPAPPPVVVYQPVPVVDYRGWGRRYHHHHGYHHDDRRDRWGPGPRHHHH